jgi:hypothetical protein
VKLDGIVGLRGSGWSLTCRIIRLSSVHWSLAINFIASTFKYDCLTLTAIFIPHEDRDHFLLFTLRTHKFEAGCRLLWHSDGVHWLTLAAIRDNINTR